MNEHGPFEQRLRRQPLRKIPADWRQEILAKAHAAAAENRQRTVEAAAAEEREAWSIGWRLVFGRLPLAWASLAALWIALIGVNLMLPTPMVCVAVQNPAADRMAELAALDYEPAPAPQPPDSGVLPANKPSEVPFRRPRSERRHGLDVGETSPGFLFDNLV
jgi:hypothetical protein